MNDFKKWIIDELVDRYQFLDPSIFECSIDLYSTTLCSNFLSTIINGTGTSASYKTDYPGEFQYCYLLRKVTEATEHEPADWFYYTVTDNAVGNINRMWKHDSRNCLEYPLQYFETEPAIQGGVSYLVLVGSQKTWMLLHEYNPCESFVIKYHGSKAETNKLKSLILQNI